MKVISNNLESINVDVLPKSDIINRVEERHNSFPPFSGGGITVIHGETQSGKTWLINEICGRVWRASKQQIILTTTLSQKAENNQLKQRISGFVKTIKLYDLDNIPAEKYNDLFGKLFIIDEGDYGVGENGRLHRVISKLLSSKLGMHIILVGATNFSLLVSDMINTELKKEGANIKHFGMLPEERDGKRYYGICDMMKNNQIIDIKENSLEIDKKTGKIPVVVKNKIIEKHNIKSGLSTIRVSLRDKEDKTSITLADKVYKNLKSDSKFDNFKVFKMYDTSKRNLLKIFEEAQYQAYYGDVIILHISGLSASISFQNDLKLCGHLRTAYETNEVVSSCAQGTPGRMSGERFSNEIPDITIFSHKDVLQQYVDMWNGIYKEGKVFFSESDITKLSTHSTHKAKSKTIEKPMNAIWKGSISSLAMLDKEILDDSYTTSRKERKTFDYNTYSEIFDTKNLKEEIYDFKKLYHGMAHGNFRKSGYIWRNYFIMKEDLDNDTCILFELHDGVHSNTTHTLKTKSLFTRTL